MMQKKQMSIIRYSHFIPATKKFPVTTAFFLSMSVVLYPKISKIFDTFAIEKVKYGKNRYA